MDSFLQFRGRMGSLPKGVRFSVSGTAREVVCCPVSVDLPPGYAECEAVSLIAAETRTEVPCQLTKSSQGIILTWLMDGLGSGEKRKYAVSPAKKVASRNDSVVVTDTPDAGRVDVCILGKLFTSYHYSQKYVRPFLYPVTGPFGTQVTRNWPMVSSVKGEHRDHIHHKSIWVAYGDCNHVDNWSEEKGHGWQRHRGFLELRSGPVFGQITARNDWCAPDGRKQFEEIRDMRFYALPGGDRLFDVNVTFRMTQGSVTFRDTKEGGLVSVRVASSMDVRNGGQIENGYVGRKCVGGAGSVVTRDVEDYSIVAGNPARVIGTRGGNRA